MGYWKCSVGIHMSAIMREIKKPTMLNDNHMLVREGIFIKMLSFCADGYRFYDAKQFAKMTSSPLKQCEIVWDICVDNNVLRECESGYSTTEWMREQGFLPSPTGRQKRLCPPSEAEADDDTTCGSDAPQKETWAEESAIARVEPPAPVEAVPDVVVAPTKEAIIEPKPRIIAPQNRVAVRTNIWLSNDEVMLLKQKYSDEDIAYMVDYYSDWKRKKGEDIRISDYQAITRWVHRVLSKKKPCVSQTIAEIPDWVHGGTNEQKRGRNTN